MSLSRCRSRAGRHGRSVLLILYCLLVPLPSGSPFVHAGETRTRSAAEQLLAELPDVPEIQRRGDAAVWQADGTVLTIEGVDQERGSLLTETVAGTVAIALHLVEDRRTDVLSSLPALAERAKGADFGEGPLRLRSNPLSGPFLRGKNAVVLTKGLLRQRKVKGGDRAAERTRITNAVAALMPVLAASGLNPSAQRATVNVLERLDRSDGKEEIDELRPSFARRLVRNGWLRKWCGKAVAAAKEAEEAVLAAERLRRISLFEGDGLRLEQLRDAFGNGGWVLTTPDGVSYARPEPDPMCLKGLLPGFTVVARLPVGGDPVKGADKVVAAKSYDASGRLAGWSAKEGFSCDVARWRKRVRVEIPDCVTGAIPPHILVAGLNGDIAGLAVEKGFLRPCRDGSRAETERFLADAARMLPNSAHMDLIGEYLFTYVHPSPDARYPWLVGTGDLRANVQQTAWQLCGNTAGGAMRGACIDLAALYEAVAKRQERTPIIMSLSGHAACAWADKRDKQWLVFVLQTGMPLEFADGSLPVCLEKAYKYFDPYMAFDPNQVPLLLRFSSEVAHTTFLLSWRIYKEPEYYRTMAEVQGDWHRHTYERAVAAMRKLIANGDHDVANYNEISSLYRVTGQYALAAEYTRKTIERSGDPVTSLNRSVDLVDYLLQGGKREEAEAVALGIVERRLPALPEQLRPASLRIAVNLSLVCINAAGKTHLRPLARRILGRAIHASVRKVIDDLIEWVESDKFDESLWENSSQIGSSRRLLDDYCDAVTTLAEELGHRNLPKDEESLAMFETMQLWFDKIAFRDLHMKSAVMYQYSHLGRWMASVFGEDELDRLLESVKPAKDPLDHTRRGAGPLQLKRDLSWGRASPTYWSCRMRGLFHPGRTTLDRAAAKRFAERMAEARAATVRLGFTAPWLDSTTDLVDLMATIAAQDEPGLRRTLHRIAGRNDGELQDRAGRTLGSTARLLDLDWYTRVLNAWAEEIGYRPVYYSIAWTAAVNKAPRHALLTAKLAAERFKDDPVFRQEYEYMRKLLETKTGKE